MSTLSGNCCEDPLGATVSRRATRVRAARSAGSRGTLALSSIPTTTLWYPEERYLQSM